MDFGIVLSLLGLIVLLYRLKPWERAQAVAVDGASDLISIIVPCRNEEKNLPRLLDSLKALTSANFEILVVDDDSSDATYAVAESLGAKVLRAGPKPDGWVGKSWACWQGARVASGRYFLFTDADTEHRPGSLAQAMSFLRKGRHDLISAPPYHLCESGWDRLLGTFHLLPLIATAFRHEPSAARLFSIGQYLLFSREAYFQVGGHERIKQSLVEDIDIAKIVVASGLSYGVYPAPTLYGVQMYSTPASFWVGWRRLLRLGFKRTPPLAVLELICVFQLLLFGLLFSPPAAFAFFLVGLFSIALSQRKSGNFSSWAVVLAPLNVALFIALSGAALVEVLMRRDVQWHGRVYDQG